MLASFHVRAWSIRFAVLIGGLVAAPLAEAGEKLALVGGRVFDPVAGVMGPARTVVVEESQISAVMTPESPLPKGARTIDCQGKYLIPGLIDAHVHLVHLADDSHVAGDEYLPLFLAHGVTSVRDVGDPIVAQAMVARDAERRPAFCPRVFLASPLIDADPPFHKGTGIALIDPKKVKAFVDDMALWNVTTLKLYVGATRDVGREVIREGRRRGMKVTAHLGVYSAQDAAADGIDCLEHIWSVIHYINVPEAMKEPRDVSTLDLGNPKARQLIADLVKNRVAVDPTLVVFRNMIYLNDLEEVHKSPDLANVPRRMLDYWNKYRFGSNLPPSTRDIRRRLIKKYQELTGLLHRSGVKILAGTDAPEPFVPPGASLHQELEMLVESGLSPAAALAAATVNVAEALGKREDIGTIEPGKRADLVILDADPTKDIRHSRRIKLVIRGGIVCDPATILQAVPK